MKRVYEVERHMRVVPKLHCGDVCMVLAEEDVPLLCEPYGKDDALISVPRERMAVLDNVLALLCPELAHS